MNKKVLLCIVAGLYSGTLFSHGFSSFVKSAKKTTSSTASSTTKSIKPPTIPVTAQQVTNDAAPTASSLILALNDANKPHNNSSNSSSSTTAEDVSNALSTPTGTVSMPSAADLQQAISSTATTVATSPTAQAVTSAIDDRTSSNNKSNMTPTAQGIATSLGMQEVDDVTGVFSAAQLARSIANDQKKSKQQKDLEDKQQASTEQMVSNQDYQSAQSTVANSTLQQEYQSMLSEILLGHYLHDDQMLQDAQTTMNTIVPKYVDALGDLISSYQSLNRPITLNRSGDIYGVFQKIIQAYVQWYIVYKQNILQKIASSVSYYDNVSNLLTTYNSYDLQITNVIKTFPADIQQQGIQLYHAELIDNFLQALIAVLQDYYNKSILSEDEINQMRSVYDIVWKIQFQGIQVMGFDTYDSFVAHITSYVAGVYEATAHALFQHVDFSQEFSVNQKIFTLVIDYYKNAAVIYSKGGMLDASKAASAESQTISDQMDVVSAAEAKLVAIENDIADAMTLSDISTTDVSGEIEKIQQFSQQLLQYKNDLAELQKQFIAGKDDVGSSVAVIKQNQVQGDLFVRESQIMWLSYLKSDQALLQSFLAMSNGSWKSTQFIDSITKLQKICMTFPNDISTVLAISPGLQQALNLYGDEGVKMAGVPSPDEKFLVLIQAAIDFIVQLNIWFSSIISMNSDQVVAHADGLADVVQKTVSQGQHLDDMYSKNNDLNQIIPNFAVSVMPTGMQTFAALSARYAYILAKEKAANLLTLASEQNDAVQKITLQASALSYYSAAQTVASFLSQTDQNDIQKQVTILSEDVNVTKQAHQAIIAAQTSGDWTAIEGSATYTSKSSLLWQQAINMNYLAVRVASAKQVDDARKNYLNTIQDYINAYQQNVTGANYSILNEMLLRYRLYLGYVLSGNDQQINTVGNDIVQLISNASKTGFFDTLQDLLSAEKAETDSDKNYADQEKIADQVIGFESVIQQQNLVATQMKDLFGSTESIPTIFFSTISDDGSSTLKCTVNGQSFSVEVPDLTALQVAHETSSGDTSFAQAQTAESQFDFYTAANEYSSAQASYKTAILKSQDPSLVNSIKQKYFLAVTRAKANLLASMFLPYGDQTLAGVEHVPVGYLMRTYNVEVPISFIGTLPADIASLDGKGIVAAPSSSLDILYGFIVSQMLQDKNLKFSDYYGNYQLGKKHGISISSSEMLTDIEYQVEMLKKKVQVAMSQGYSVAGTNQKMGVKLLVQSTGITFECTNIPVEAVEPLFSTMVYAAEYVVGAYNLFKPGTALLQLSGGGPSYVPGQDADAAKQMQKLLAQMYLVGALRSITDADYAAQQSIIKINANKDHARFDLSNHMIQYQNMKNYYETALSLLMANEQSAYQYFKDAGDDTSAGLVMKYVADVYQKQADATKKFLVGDPTSNFYNTIVRDLNMIYFSQGALAGADTHAFSVQTALLFKFVGDACMKFTYKDEGVEVDQHHYMNASSNYLAAASEYQTLSDDEGSAAMTLLANKAYFYACAENMTDYLSMKNNGASYKSTSGETVHVTWLKLMTDYESFTNQYSLQATSGIDANEIQLYDEAKNLLLDAAIYYQVVDSGFGKLASSGSVETTEDSQKAIVAFLKDQGVMDSDETTIDYLSSDVVVKINGLAEKGYEQFATDMKKLAAWSGVLFEAVGYLYIQDFLGGISGTTDLEKSQNAQTKWTEVTQALQVAGTALQNPSAAYVG